MSNIRITKRGFKLTGAAANAFFNAAVAHAQKTVPKNVKDAPAMQTEPLPNQEQAAQDDRISIGAGDIS
jgi:hypothetical protein